MQVYEDGNLEETAKAVIHFNRFAKGYSLEDMKNRILSVVKDYPGQRTGYVRTGGFFITFFVPDHSNDPHVKFSIDTSTLIDYLENSRS